ncbi:hypothetical protein [Corynebacterium mastitidis]|uniref:hypothetical protein n=1 Tax=Corynebacterium mastitidis TaxID=161890 RepID=UPI0012EAB218|nr:hypothetical protein [Corynebacterium mastitidis]
MEATFSTNWRSSSDIFSSVSTIASSGQTVSFSLSVSAFATLWGKVNARAVLSVIALMVFSLLQPFLFLVKEKSWVRFLFSILYPVSPFR